jgi:hypothetical protein
MEYILLYMMLQPAMFPFFLPSTATIATSTATDGVLLPICKLPVDVGPADEVDAMAASQDGAGGADARFSTKEFFWCETDAGFGCDVAVEAVVAVRLLGRTKPFRRSADIKHKK